MSEGRVELPGGICATEAEALSALVREAKRRGISYGELVAATSVRERDDIIRSYCGSKRRKGRRRGNGR